MSRSIYHNRPIRTCSHIAMASVLGLCATLAVAQTDPAAADEGGEILVTAQKRAQSQQDVGITMSVINGSDLAGKGVGDVSELAKAIANVQVNYGAGQTAFNVRGIGINEFASNIDSPIAVHIDEIYVPRTFETSTLLFDIDHVEALKGPQGTLFGRNATGGAVNFYTNNPTRDLTAGGSIGFDNYRTLHGEAYVSGPITDTLSARLAGFVTDQDRGFVRNLTLGKRDGKTKKLGLRAKLMWEADATKVLVTGTYGQDRSTLIPYSNFGIITPASFAAGTSDFCPEYLDGTVNGATAGCVRGPDGMNPGDTNPLTTKNNQEHKLRNTNYSGSVRVEHDLGASTLTSISSYQYGKRNQVEDSDSGPLTSRALYYHAVSKAFTQEVRLASSGERTWNYVLGSFYEHENFKSADYFSGNGGDLPLLYSPFSTKLDAFAIFMNNDVKVTPTLSLIAGIRYSNERISLNGKTWLASGLQDGLPTTLIVALSDSSLMPAGENPNKSAGTTFKVGMTWEPDISAPFVDHLLLYGNVSTGFRSGSFNASFATIQQSITSLSPEKITAYESGFKTTLLDRRLTINGAVFHYKFEDGFINVDVPGTPVPVTVNAADISTTGVELDGRFRVIPQLTVFGGIGWLDAAIQSDITSANITLKGDRPVNSPKWTYNFGAEFATPLTSDLELKIGGSANYRSAQYMEAVNAPSNLEPSYWLVDAQASLGAPDGRWQASVWGKNLTKSVYRTYVNDLPALGYIVNAYAEPRTFGLTLSYRY